MSEKQQYLSQLVEQYRHHHAAWVEDGCPTTTPRYRQMTWLAGRIDLLRPHLKVVAVDEDGHVELTRISRHDIHIITVRHPRERVTGLRF